MTSSAMNKQRNNERKRARNGSGYVRQRVDGRWEGQYYFEGKHKSVYGNSESEAAGKLSVQLAAIYEGSYIDKKMMPLYSYLHWWHETYTSIRPSTHANYNTYIESHLFNSKLGSLPLGKLKLADFKEFFDSKKNNGRLDGRTGGLSPKTQKNIKNMLNKALKLAVYPLQYIPIHPMTCLEIPKPIPKEIKILTERDQDRLEQIVLSYRDKNALLILIDLYCGARIGELCGLMWPDLARDKSFFKIRRTLERLPKAWADLDPEYTRIPMLNAKPNAKTALYIGPPKSHRSKRKIYTIDETFNCFVMLEQYQKEQGIFDPNGFIFRQQNGNPYEPRTYEEFFKRVLIQAELDGYTPHKLRHTFATRALENDFELASLSSALGHGHRSTTLNMYVHDDDAARKRNMRKISKCSA